ncbi:MAG TPA: HAD family hydrolase [Acidimicrobiales bacterium]|nr:HAD family hydrolase [Acidimicrobiales bacterium]
MTVDAIVFDWGGTLTLPITLDELDELWHVVARHIAPDREDEVAAHMARVEAECWARVNTDQKAFSLGALLERCSEELGMDATGALLEEAAAHHLDWWTPRIAHDPDAAPTLAALKGEGVRIGLLSNTHWPRSFHENFLEREGLVEFIDVRCYTSEMAHTKPHPEAFRTVLRELDVKATDAVFVGDRLYDDIFGAKALGMKAVHRRDRGVPDYDVQPDAVIDRLPELIPLVDKWLTDPS